MTSTPGALPQPLSPIEQRVLGALLEKQVTVPAGYPLSLNSLRTACNQTSSREPVTDYDDNALNEALHALRDRDLVRFVWAGKGSRTVKYHQRLEETLALTPAQRALLTVLLLRGAQAPGELRTRTERLHPFDDRAQVEAELSAMAATEPPLVRELPRRPGQQDHRWVHLLGPVAASGPADAPAQTRGPDLEAVLADGAAARDQRVLAAYDAAAQGYAAQLSDELTDKPFDRWLLTRVAELAAGGPVVEVGCGPGQVAAFLRAAGAQVSGVDRSPAMIDIARERHPEMTFTVGDLRSLLRPPAAPAWSAIVAWYALVHLAPSELAPALSGLARTLAPGGTLALALHLGGQVRHTDALFGAEVDVDFVLHEQDSVVAAIAAAGLTVQEWYVRGPVADVEVATDRLYVVARSPQ